MMNKTLYVILAFLLSGNIFAQEKIYLNKRGEVIDSHADATRYKILSTNTETGRTTETLFKIGDTLVSRIEFSDYENQVRDGKSERFSPDGWVAYRSNYKNNRRDGELVGYWNASTPRRIEHYLDDKMIDGKCFDKDGNEIPYFPGEVKPEYPGGNQKLYSDITNDFKVKGNGKGKIIVQFIIEKDGSVADVLIRQGINAKLDKEAVRVIKSLPKWTPGSQEGKPVRVMYSIPINISR